MTRRTWIAVLGAGVVMILFGLALDLTGVAVPGNPYTLGLLTAVVVSATGEWFREDGWRARRRKPK